MKFDFLGLRTLTVIDWAVKIINAQRAAPGRAAARHQRAADGRRADLRAAQALRDHRGVPAGIARHEGPDPPPAARLLRGHRRARGAVPPGPAAVGHGRRLHRAQARQDDRSDRLPASRPEAGARADLRRDPVPGAGDADRAGAGRLHARRRRPAAPRDGQEEARGDGEAALDLRRRRDRARRRAAHGRAHLRPDGEVRGLRLQQVALRRVRAAVVPDAWLKAHYPAAFMSAVLSSDMDKTDKVVDADRRSATHAAQGRAAGRQHLALHVHRQRRAQHPLRARRDQRRRAVGGRDAGRRARGARCVPRYRRPVPAQRPEPHEPPRARSADPLRRARPDRREPRDADARAALGDAAGGPDDPRARRRPERHVRSDGPRGRGADGHAQQRSAAGLEPPRAPRRRARHARAVSHRASVRGVRARGAADRQRPHRRHHRRPPAAEQRRASSSSAASRPRSRAWCSISASAAAA